MKTTSKIQIGTQVKGTLGNGTITSIITKSTGYVEVTYTNGKLKKEMAFNLLDENNEPLKNKPTEKPLTGKCDNEMKEKMRMSVLQDNFLDCQIKSGNYNMGLVR